MPRTGLPDLFRNAADYEHYVSVLTRAGASGTRALSGGRCGRLINYPTPELRVADTCTRLDDVLAVKALYGCLVRLAVRCPELKPGADGRGLPRLRTCGGRSAKACGRASSTPRAATRCRSRHGSKP